MGVKVARLFQWTLVDRIGSAGILFLCMMILARFVTPKDFGAIGALTLFISLGNLLVDCGLGGALIKKKDASPTDFGTLFVYNGVCSISLYVLFWLLAPLVNWFFRDDSLARVLKVLSLIFIFNAISIVQYVKLVKNLEVKKLCLISIASGGLACIIAIVMAVHGCGVWACVFYFVLQSLFRSCGYYLVIWQIPHFCFSWQSFKQQFNFGGYLLGANILTVVSSHLTTFAIGRMFPMSVLGYYYQAHRLYSANSELLTAVIDRVAFPVLCKSTDQESMQVNSKNIFNPLFVLLYPLFAVGVVVAEQFVVIAFGELWRSSGIYFAILLVSLFPAMVRIMLRNIFKSAGATGLIFRAELLTIVFTLILVGCSLFISILCLVGSMVGSMFFTMFTYMFYSHSRGLVKCQDVCAMIASPLCSALASAGVAVLVQCVGNKWCPPVVTCCAAGFAGVVTAFVYYAVTKNPVCLQFSERIKRKRQAP
ncbi:MAG: lipopolysaccharide biosynthesis protein [Lentisphaeria bacterium]|nr:lipopolysaccharide biosynthesis protein [Lentisphaeria bacterium]